MKNLLCVATAVAVAACSSSSSNDTATEAQLTTEIATWQGFRTAAVSYTFDDNCPNQYTAAVPLFDALNYKATFYPIGKDIANWPTLQQCANNGHEIGSHTTNHPALSQLPADEAEAELSGSKNHIDDHLTNNKCLTIAYPFCVPTDTALTAKYYIAARHCDGRIEKPTPDNFYNISSFALGSEAYHNDAPRVIELFSQTRQQGGWCVLLLHEIDEGYGYSPYPSAELGKTLQYLKDNDADYWVATLREVAKYIKERNATAAVATQQGDNIELTLTNNLNAEIFDEPLTVRISPSKPWSGAKATQNGKECRAAINNGTIEVDAVPNAGTVTIQPL